ncbi:sigma-54-dependent transcriptional regulator [Acidobacteriota bacterium]
MTSILVVDDELPILQLIKTMLEGVGFEIHVAQSGKEALDLFRKVNPDLAIVDFAMPGMTGMELMHAIHEYDPTFPVIVMSGTASMDEALDSLKNGAVEYLAKPFQPGELVFRIRKSIELGELRRENRKLKIKARPRLRKSDYIIGTSPAIKDIFDKIDTVARSNVPVLVMGESGTGKELVARAVHHQSLRCDSPFVTVNCGAIPEALLENELFGHVKGAYTGAHSNQKGQFHAAHQGTLFLDEIGEMPLSLQVKLLRFLQSYEFKPLGGSDTIKVDVRLVAATNRDLKEMIRQRTFREDLYYRIHIIPIDIPPLRERREDIPLLSEFFLRQIADKIGKRFESISPETVTLLMSYHWPGNVRELENIITRMAISCTNEILTAEEIPFGETSNAKYSTFKAAKQAAIAQFERAYIINMLKCTHGNIAAAARRSQKDRKDFWTLMKKYGITAEQFKSEQKEEPSAPTVN